MERVPAVPSREPCASLTDPRCANARPHLLDILVRAICAGLCGAEGWEESEESGHAQAAWCTQGLDMPHGIPSHDTLRRGLARLDPDECTPCFLPWPQALSERRAGPRRRSTIATQSPARGPNSGPTTIAPTIRICELVKMPTAPIRPAIASKMKKLGG